MDKLKEVLVNEFEIKDLWPLKYFLGMEVACSKKGIVVSHWKHVLDLLKETRMLRCKPSNTPMKSNYKVGPITKSPLVDKWMYQQLVGKLVYLSHTRLDIGFSISVVSQYMNNPNEKHLEAVYWILWYLKMTPRKDIYFRKWTNKGIEVYFDVDWVGFVQDKRSTTDSTCMFEGIL